MKLYLIKKKKGRQYDSREMALAACGLSLAHDEKGRPFSPGGPFVSVSDTKRWWALLTANSPCGLDIEEESRRISASTAKRLHALEQEYLAGLEAQSSEWKREFLSIWVRKESYMKFCGEGLAMGLARFSVLDESLSYAEQVCAKDHPKAFVTPLKVQAGLYAAAALQEAEELEAVKTVEYEGIAQRDILDEAAALLSLRAMSSKEMRTSLLRKGFGADEADEAVRRLLELSYLDDEALAKTYAEDAAAKGKGRLRIARELQQKGVTEGVTRRVLAELSEDEEQLTERERALLVAKKMLKPGETPDDKMLSRIGRRLAALGYETSVIWDVLAACRP